ncbi:hypothetical protein CTAM01_05196, partial [Colletotrichum tamarilloi]
RAQIAIFSLPWSPGGEGSHLENSGHPSRLRGTLSFFCLGDQASNEPTAIATASNTLFSKGGAFLPSLMRSAMLLNLTDVVRMQARTSLAGRPAVCLLRTAKGGTWPATSSDSWAVTSQSSHRTALWPALVAHRTGPTLRCTSCLRFTPYRLLGVFGKCAHLDS